MGSPDPITGECPPGTDPDGTQCSGEPLEIVGDPTCEDGELNPTTGECDNTTTSSTPLSCDDVGGGTLGGDGTSGLTCSQPNDPTLVDLSCDDVGGGTLGGDGTSGFNCSQPNDPTLVDLSCDDVGGGTLGGDGTSGLTCRPAK